eukprot:Hpha_TRINITY_DN16798_c1_g8::TRINITY_DN16798_c1_g8_i1::g.77814::m.77814
MPTPRVAVGELDAKESARRLRLQAELRRLQTENESPRGFAARESPRVALCELDAKESERRLRLQAELRRLQADNERFSEGASSVRRPPLPPPPRDSSSDSSTPTSSSSECSGGPAFCGDCSGCRRHGLDTGETAYRSQQRLLQHQLQELGRALDAARSELLAEQRPTIRRGPFDPWSSEPPTYTPGPPIRPYSLTTPCTPLPP